MLRAKYAVKPATVPKLHCAQCAALSINGVFCHEISCPNSGSRFDHVSGDWIKQRECCICGYTCDVDSACCSDSDSEAL